MALIGLRKVDRPIVGQPLNNLFQSQPSYYPSNIPFVNMSPIVNHPPGVNFVDDLNSRSVNVDAATYYRDETHSRSRTYSHVGFAHSTF